MKRAVLFGLPKRFPEIVNVSEKTFSYTPHECDKAEFSSSKIMAEGGEIQDDRTPLHRACSNGQIGLVRKLIQDGVAVDPVDEMGWTPLIIATSAGHLEIVDYLVQKGASVRATTVNGQTALHYAASKGHLDICRNLISYGADVNARDRLLQTPLHRAASRGNEEIVKLLLSTPGIQLNPADTSGNTPLHLACEEERENIVKLLIKAGANLEYQNKEKKTPLEMCQNQKLAKSWKNFAQQN